MKTEEKVRNECREKYMALQPKISDGTATEEERMNYHCYKMMYHSFFGASDEGYNKAMAGVGDYNCVRLMMGL